MAIRELAKYASHASESKGRLHEGTARTLEGRSEFQRDRDRIIHSGAFRKLQYKTQVFINHEGDYFRTRLTHSLEVAQIARSVARQLHLDEDLAECIALAHDLGHTCFGHAGEDALDDAMRPYGGFDHNDQTFRIVTKLERKYPHFDGLNLTWESLEGIVKHNGPVLPLKTNEKIPYTIQKFQSDWDLELNTFASAEAQIAAIADDIAYSTHDIDDSFRMQRLTLAELYEAPMIGALLLNAQKMYPETEERRLIYVAVSQMMAVLVEDLLVNARRNLEELNPNSVHDIRSAQKQVITLSDEKAKDLKELKSFLMERVFKSELMLQIREEVQEKLKFLFHYYLDDPKELPDDWYQCYVADHNLSQNDKAKVIADYVAGMTDRFALKKYDEIV